MKNNQKAMIRTILLLVAMVCLSAMSTLAIAEPAKSFETDVVSISSGEMNGKTGPGVGAIIKIENTNSPSRLLATEAKYLYLNWSDSVLSEEDIQADLGFISEIDDFAPLPIDDFRAPTGNGKFHFYIYILDVNKKPYAYLVNHETITIGDGGLANNVVFTFYQIAELADSTKTEQSPNTELTTKPVEPSEVTDNIPAKEEQSSQVPIVVAAVALPIALAGGVGAVFFALNMSDYKETIKLISSSNSLARRGSASASNSNTAPRVERGRLTDRIKMPFLYMKFRKYTMILGKESLDENGLFLRRVNLNFKSRANLDVDLSEELMNLDYRYLTVRYPIKSMKNKQDVKITYHYDGTVIDQDQFDSDQDFVNIKNIEKQ